MSDYISQKQYFFTANPEKDKTTDQPEEDYPNEPAWNVAVVFWGIVLISVVFASLIAIAFSII